MGEGADTGFNQNDSSNEQFDSYGNNMSSEEELGADGNLTGGSGKVKIHTVHRVLHQQSYSWILQNIMA